MPDPRSLTPNPWLLNFFVGGVLIAVGAELFQFQPCRGVAAVLFGGVTGDPWRALVRVGAALGTL
jgi:hypothetical protein